VRAAAPAPSGGGPLFLRLRVALLAGIGALSSLSAFAQAGGGGGPSIASDEVPLERTIPDRDVIKDDLDRSRFHLGPVRLLPGFFVTDAGYDSNVFGTAENPVADWTFTIRAGTRFLLPMGSKFVFAGDAFPQYTWYHDLTERDEFGGIYNGSLFGFFNRLTTELTGFYSERYRIYSSEIDSRVFTKSGGGLARFELELSSHWSLFGQGTIEKVRYEQIQGPPVQDEGVQLNNRTAWAGRGGVRYHITQDWNVAALVEGTWADFETDPRLRNNTSTAYLMSLEYSRPRLFVHVIGGWREGQGSDGQFFPNYSTGVGSFFVSFFPISWLELQINGLRSVTYSISEENPYYFENRLGARLRFSLGERARIFGYYTEGPNNYPRPAPVPGDGFIKRRDQQKLYGGGLSMLVVRPVVLTGQVTRSVVDSNLPGASRAYNRYTIFLSFSGVLEK